MSSSRTTQPPIVRRAALYARVSTKDQTPENQLATLRAFAANRGWRATEFVDHGVSGAKERRPALGTTVGRALKRGLSWPLRSIPPMLPTPAPPFHRPGWIYEEKYDGWRIMAYKQGAAVRLLSRNGIDSTRRFRELAAAIAALPASTVILDGEVAVFDEHLLSRRDFLRRPDPGAVVTPPIYITFDCVHAGGRDLRHSPLGARREVLEALLDGAAGYLNIQ